MRYLSPEELDELDQQFDESEPSWPVFILGAMLAVAVVIAGFMLLVERLTEVRW